MSQVVPVVLVHGGAGDIPDSSVQEKIDGVKVAAIEGYKVLKRTNSVLDAVEAAVKVMEDLEGFNAGMNSCRDRYLSGGTSLLLNVNFAIYFILATRKIDIMCIIL